MSREKERCTAVALRLVQGLAAWVRWVTEYVGPAAPRFSFLASPHFLHAIPELCAIIIGALFGL